MKLAHKDHLTGLHPNCTQSQTVPLYGQLLLTFFKLNSTCPGPVNCCRRDLLASKVLFKLITGQLGGVLQQHLAVRYTGVSHTDLFLSNTEQPDLF